MFNQYKIKDDENFKKVDTTINKIILDFIAFPVIGFTGGLALSLFFKRK